MMIHCFSDLSKAHGEQDLQILLTCAEWENLKGLSSKLQVSWMLKSTTGISS